MRILLALIVLVAAVVALLLLLPSRFSPATVEPAAERAADRAPSTPLDLAPTQSRTAGEPSAEVEAVSEPSAAEAWDGTCRVEIVLTGAPAGFRTGVDVRCSDALGREVPHSVASPTSWIVPHATVGEYHVELRPSGGELLPAAARFAVAAEERAKRVELPLRRARSVRVRWQAADGRPIVAALLQPGVLLGPALLQVGLATERIPPGSPAPASSRSVAYNVRPDGDSSEENPRLPAWEGAPPDGFALLNAPPDGPCAVNASIGGLVVDSAEVGPETREIVFRTHLDVVRDARTILRFCVVAAESGEPIANAVFAANTGSGIGYGSVEVGPEGCREEPRLLAGTWTLILLAQDRTPVFREIDLAPGAELDLGKIAMQEECPLRVRLTLPDGRPATGVTGVLLSTARFELGHRKGGDPQGDGVLSFTQVTDEPQSFVVVDDRWACTPRLIPECRADRTRDELTVQLEEGVSVALDLGPSPHDPQVVFVYDTNGLPVVRGNVSSTGLVALRLAPGDYLVVRPEQSGAHAFSVGRESVVIDVR